MKKAAIITLYGDYNYGNKLQNYAVQEICSELGYECTTIRYEATMHNIGRKGRLIALLGFPKKLAQKKRFAIKSEHMFKEFSQQYLNTSEPMNLSSAAEIAESFDYFVAGSDQIWNIGSNPDDDLNYFFLKFVPEHKRICFAPSFGFDNVPEKYKQLYTDGLNGFRHLSCREEQGCRIIKELTGRDAQLLCDPTLMLPAEQWDKISAKPKFPLPEKYILTYFLGETPPNAAKYIDELAKKTGYPVINLYKLEYPEYFYVSPDEFLYLIRNADHLCTNSFHGCVFSIIYHTEFTVFERIDSKGMHSRIDTLLDMFGLQSRDAAENNTDIPCDFSCTDKIIQQNCEKGMAYLRQAFSDAYKERTE